MSTHGSEEQFWASVRRSVQDATSRETVEAGAVDAAELAAAERLLAAVDESPPEPLPEAQVDTMVRDAVHTIDLSTPKVATGGAAAVGRAPRRMGRLLAAAVALCATPMFLAAAAVVTVAAVTSVVLRHTTQTLSFQDAVRYLVSDGSPDSTRNPALGTVHADLIWTIQVVQQVASGDTGPSDAALLAAAKAVLQRVRAELSTPDRFVLRPMPGHMLSLVEQVEDRSLGADVRQRALQRLADLMVYGVSALKEIERTPQSDRITRQVAAVLVQLARFLE